MVLTAFLLYFKFPEQNLLFTMGIDLTDIQKCTFQELISLVKQHHLRNVNLIATVEPSSKEVNSGLFYHQIFFYVRYFVCVSGKRLKGA